MKLDSLKSDKNQITECFNLSNSRLFVKFVFVISKFNKVFLKYVLLPPFQVPWQGTGGNEKFFFENENVCWSL